MVKGRVSVTPRTYQRDSGLVQDKDSGLLTMMLPSCTTTFFDALGLGGMEVDLRRNLLLMDLDDSCVWMDDLDEVSVSNEVACLTDKMLK